MPIYFQRPENALKRANEFIEVGKKEPALDVLYDVIKSKKHRTWQKIHEPILFKYLELCVDLRRSHVAKEGLYQYRLICQHVNVNSLECVIRHFLQLAEDRASRAQGESRDQVVVDDLDNIQTPESVLLSFVSGEDVQDRTDRIMLTPWLKFLWEAYRNVLELLRNNIRVEKLYHETAQQAFKFCLKYTRRTEFRKLCDNIRNHLTNIMKHHGQPNAINLSNPDTLQMHLETRLAQLDSAVNMELWQEAFKAVEDIHGLMQLSKKHPKPQVMANYYQKVALVFWKAENYLFHAAALQKLLVLSREQKKTITPEEVKRMASKVLLATLSVPIPPPSSDSDRFLNLDDISREKIKRLSVLLGLQGTPSRQLLIKELVKMNVIQFALPELQDLFHWLEKEFHPLQLCAKVSNVLEFLKSNEDLELAQYVRPIERIAVMRVLKQASQVYQNIQFSHLLKMIPFVTEFELEQIVVDAAKDGSLQVRLDHRTKSVSFGTDLCVGNLDGISEGPHLQAMMSEKMHSQLILMSQALQRAMRIIKPSPLDKDRDELREHLVQSYLRTARKEHQQTMQRKVIIEARKEHQENIHNERERREHQEMERQRQKALEAERKRLEEEARVREQQRKQRELMEIEKKQALEKINALKKTTIGARALKDLTAEEIEDMDADDIIARQVEQLDRDKKEMQTRLKSQEKRVDYLARALRQEEIPLLKRQYDEQLVKDKEFWEKEEDERITAVVAEHDKALTVKGQLGRMVGDKDAFVKILHEKRQAIFKDQLKAFNEDLEAKRKERLEKRRKQRLVERKQKFLREKEEAFHREQEEKCRKEEEERKQKEKEEKEAKEREYKEYLAKLEEQARKQREREQEIEEKMRRKTDEPGGVIEQREPGWRDDRGGPRGRDERDFGGRDDRREGRWGPPRDGPPRDGPPRDGPPRDGPPRDAWRRGDDGPRGPPPEDRGWRRGGGDDDDRPPPWRPCGGRDDDDRGPGRDDRGWRSRGRDDDDRGPPPGRDDWRSRGRDDERGPPREDRPAAWRPRAMDDEDRGPRDWRSRDREDDDRGPPRDDRAPAWRGRGRDDERGPPPRDDRDDKGPPPGDDRPPAWRPRGGDREDSGPPPREDRWRRDDDRGPPPPRDGPGAWRRDRDDRGPPPRGEDRWRGGPDDRERGPPRGRWGDRDGGGDSDWRKGRDDDQGRRDDDRRGGGAWRGGRDDDRDRPGPGRWGDRGGDRGSWRERTDERPAMKDDRDMGRREPPKEAGRSWQAARVRRNETDGSDGDGWTVVEKK